MAESHMDTVGPLAHGDELVVRPARIKMALLFVFLLACLGVAALQV